MLHIIKNLNKSWKFILDQGTKWRRGKKPQREPGRRVTSQFHLNLGAQICPIFSFSAQTEPLNLFKKIICLCPLPSCNLAMEWNMKKRAEDPGQDLPTSSFWGSNLSSFPPWKGNQSSKKLDSRHWALNTNLSHKLSVSHTSLSGWACQSCKTHLLHL